jgi:uncharacterized protein (DUF1015 family)
MATIRPFQGVRYNQAKVDLSSVVTPPYDVISPADQEWYRQHDPHTMVRLILPQGDGEKYENAASCLHDWLDKGILIRDEEPSLYALEQEYEVNGKRMKRLGFSCAVRLEDYDSRTVLPHENILAKPMDDRLNLMRSAKSNFDSVFGLFDDDSVENTLRPFLSRDPDACAVDKDGVVCRLWKISDRTAISAIVNALADKSLVIADGHHRYAAALAYRDEMRQAAGASDPEAPYEFVMMTLVSLADSGLVILPTHRLVRNVDGFDAGSFLSKLSESFDVEEIAAEDLESVVQKLGDEKYVFGLYMGPGMSFVIKLKNGIRPEQAIQSPGSDALKQLDVSVLHSMILDAILGIGAQQMAAQSNLSYTRDPESAMKSVDAGENQALFLMNSTRVEEVRAVAAAGDKMPQKSTFFYPKLITGLLMRVME